MNILENIKKIRKEAGISQEYIASELGIDVANYSRLESGKHELKVSQLAIIAKVLQEDEIYFYTYPKRYVDRDSISNAERISVTFEVSPDKRDILLNLVTKI